MTNQIEEFRQEVYENCLEGKNNCQGCKVRAPSKEAHPEFGGMNPNAQLALVNNSPGGPDETADLNRTRGDTITDVSKLPSTLDDNYQTNESVSRPYTHKLLHEWYNLDGTKKGPLEQLKPNVFESTYDGIRIGIDLKDTYYTNSLKCPEFGSSVENSGQRNHDGRTHCCSYLEYELRELVEPSIVLTGGEKATATVLAALERKLEGDPQGYGVEREGVTYRVPDPFKKLLSGDSEFNPRFGEGEHPIYGVDPAIVPTYQFSGINLGYWHIDWIPEEERSKEDYYRELVKCLSYELDRVGAKEK